MGRKVTLTASEVGFANKNGIKLEDLAKAKLPKRGRPVGSKNKVKFPDVYPPGSKSFEETLEEWDKAEQELLKKVDWEAVARKQEEKLRAYMIENDELAQICISRWEEIQHLKYLVSYLEGKHEDSSV